MLDIKPLSEELQKVACDELGEVPDRVPEDLEAFKAWIQRQPHLKCRLEDQFLVQFLRGCKYSLERAKEKLEHFYSLRTKYPDMLSACDVDNVKFRQYHNTKSFLALPRPLHEYGPRIIYMQFAFDPSAIGNNDILQYTASFSEMLLMRDPYACIQGVVVIYDYAKFNTDYIPLMTPTAAKTLFQFFEKALPIRIKGIYIVNIWPFVEKFLELLLPYIPEKIKNRIHFCGNNIEDLGDVLPKRYFPKDCGGENGSLEELCAEHNKVWDELREYFKQNSEYGTDERLRLGEQFENSGELGAGGSFRKIAVD